MASKPTTREIRKAFLDYFAANGHRIVPSSSLIPAGDATLLFTNAGMNQFKDVFLGREQRDYMRATSCQKCVRAGGKHNDLENVGYTARHHTFFEMLGNFSFGDYFKADAIRFAWELLVGVYKLPSERLWFTVYTDDDEAARLWEQVGAPADRILRFGEKENFWAMGETGPCGPCSEIHYYQGKSLKKNRPELVNGPGDDTVEIWNLVFMQYERDATGHLHPLPSPCVDTGAGLERLAAVMQGVGSNYDTDVFAPILARIVDLAQRPYDPASELGPAFRVIADHARAAAFLLADGVVPSNEGRGYVLRRIVRRALRYGRQLGFDGVFLADVVPAVIRTMGDVYPELAARWPVVEQLLRTEEERFSRTLNVGTDLIGRELDRIKRAGGTTLPGETAFHFYETHGIPIDILDEFAQEEGLAVDRDGFDAKLETARQRGQEDQHIAALFHRHLVLLGALAAAVDLSVGLRVGAQIVRREGEAPAVHARVIHHRLKLRLHETRAEEQREGRRGVDHVHGGDAAVREVLLGEVEGGAVGIGHQFVGGERLPVGQHGQLRVLFAAGLAEIGHQFRVETFGSLQ